MKRIISGGVAALAFAALAQGALAAPGKPVQPRTGGVAFDRGYLPPGVAALRATAGLSGPRAAGFVIINVTRHR